MANNTNSSSEGSNQQAKYLLFLLILQLTTNFLQPYYTQLLIFRLEHGFYNIPAIMFSSSKTNFHKLLCKTTNSIGKFLIFEPTIAAVIYTFRALHCHQFEPVGITYTLVQVQIWTLNKKKRWTHSRHTSKNKFFFFNYFI